MNLLIQAQLSNYDTSGKFILECDSGYQMVAGRAREIKKTNPLVKITLVLPSEDLLLTHPDQIGGNTFFDNYIHVPVLPNALATRYDFNFDSHLNEFRNAQEKHGNFDAVYINDPMLLRHYKAIFTVIGNMPKFFVHSHFVDVPSNPKFSVGASLWLGQLEAAQRADFNFWQCSSALKEFNYEARDVLQHDVVDSIMEKSLPWDDGYSDSEMSHNTNYGNVRFLDDRPGLDSWGDLMNERMSGKVIVFIPNRIGGYGRSSDYTNCGKFIWDFLPHLAKVNPEIINKFVIIAGNPSQKFSNHEIADHLSQVGVKYMNLVPGTFARDEYRLLASFTDISVGLYDQDTYGGTASRELLAAGSFPFWVNVNSYSEILEKSGVYEINLANVVDFANSWNDFVTPDTNTESMVEPFTNLVNFCHKLGNENTPRLARVASTLREIFMEYVYNNCSYEASTPAMLELMKNICKGGK